MALIEKTVEVDQDGVENFRDLNIRILPETPTIGAVVEGVNGKEPLSDEVIVLLKDALMRYKVLIFRDQHLSNEEHQRFTCSFGPAFANPARFLAEYDEEGLTSVSVVPHFHADLMYQKQGPSFSMLQMHEKPAVGGDTMWADLVSSYQDLSPTMREFLEGLTAINGRRTYFWPDDLLLKHHKKHYREDLSPEQLKQLREYLTPNENPVVRVIPETGVRSYWISEEHTQKIKELSEQESDALLKMLFAHQLQPRYIFRHKWNVGDIAFWDHRTTLHSGIADFGSQKRHGKRQSIALNVPISVEEWNATAH
jgi:taurine dioxygenase